MADAAQTRLELAAKVLKQAHASIGAVLELLGGGDAAKAQRALTDLVATRQEAASLTGVGGEEKIVEGVFNGKDMVGGDGKLYTVPPNYASKSRLVEGDVLKLSIDAGGSFTFKQIAPVDRRRRVGTLAYDASEKSHVVLCGEDVYHVNPASVSYYKGEPGDEAVVLVPSGGVCMWAAIENIVKK